MNMKYLDIKSEMWDLAVGRWCPNQLRGRSHQMGGHCFIYMPEAWQGYDGLVEPPGGDEVLPGRIGGIVSPGRLQRGGRHSGRSIISTISH